MVQPTNLFKINVILVKSQLGYGTFCSINYNFVYGSDGIETILFIFFRLHIASMWHFYCDFFLHLEFGCAKIFEKKSSCLINNNSKLSHANFRIFSFGLKANNKSKWFCPCSIFTMAIQLSKNSFRFLRSQ